MNVPNFIVIMSDQHSPHVLGSAGNPVVRTPNLDRLAGQGVQFEHAYCAHPLCVPSRMAFVTERFPLDLGIWSNAGVLSSDVPTFAHALNAAGYDTVLCGRMHFVGSDQNHGFSHRLVGDVSGAMDGAPERSGLFEGIWPSRANGQCMESLMPEAVGPGVATYELFDAAVTERACRWIEERARRRNTAPFALVIGFLLPHNPYVCSKDLFEEYMEKLPAEKPGEFSNEHPAVVGLRKYRRLDHIPPEQFRRARAAYYGLVTTLDRNIGRILETLEATHLAANTHVVYTSDHGDMCGEHGLWWKDSFYEASVGVPLLWAPPSRDVPGCRIHAVVSLVDISATLLDLAGAPSLPGGRGRSLRRFLYPDSELPIGDSVWPDEAFAEIFVGVHGPARMLRRGRWKLCAYGDFQSVQLFDMETDPEETQDLGQVPKLADIRKKLESSIRAEWNPETVKLRHAQRMAAQELLFRTGMPQEPIISEHWPFPVRGNVKET